MQFNNVLSKTKGDNEKLSIHQYC